MRNKIRAAQWKRFTVAVPCCDTLCSRLWLVVVVLALLRSVLVRTWTSAVGRALFRLFAMTILLVPTLVACGDSTELSVECELGPDGLLFEPAYKLVRRSFPAPELPLLLPVAPLNFEQRKHFGNHECFLMNFLYSLRTYRQVFHSLRRLWIIIKNLPFHFEHSEKWKWNSLAKS